MEVNGFMDSMIDSRDEQKYPTIKIGSQTWFAQNLNYKIGNSYCYDDDFTNCNKYGRLYDWETAVTACPEGWHLPSDNEWKILEMYLGISQSEVNDESWRGTTEGEKMKSKNVWGKNGSGTNLNGFNALPAGIRNIDDSFNSLGYGSGWWTSTDDSGNGAWYRYLRFDNVQVYRAYYQFKTFGLSVRCIKD